jgi:3'-phosphoadenosine 5'-phosphosulfate sulfotransferase (PAPS reductase)/FAD synthetase
MTRKSDEKRHILALSGGKDSAALAVYLKDRIPNLEYVFLDTGHELPETYAYLDRMEAVMDIAIQKLHSGRSFEDWLKLKGFYLPSQQKRWCTELLKIKVYENYVGSDQIYSYIGLRADENREGYISTKHNIIPRYPFIKDGLILSDIENILNEYGLGLPSYYKWRSRSGCYFCFFQQGIEWLNLYKHHPDLYEKAASFEKVDPSTGKHFTWREGESLYDLLNRADEISSEYFNRKNGLPIKKGKLIDTLKSFEPCFICTS